MKKPSQDSDLSFQTKLKENYIGKTFISADRIVNNIAIYMQMRQFG
jgi:hypothetical protein